MASEFSKSGFRFFEPQIPGFSSSPSVDKAPVVCNDTWNETAILWSFYL
jgi:hypothetical protein